LADTVFVCALSRAFSVQPQLPYHVVWQELKDWFRVAGKVIRAHIPLNAAQQSRGYGIVLYEQSWEARQAIRMFNETIWNGRNLKVREERKQQGSSNTTTFPFPTSLDHSSSHAKPSLTSNNNHSSTASSQAALSSTPFASSPGASTPIAPSSARPLSSTISSAVASAEMLPRSAHASSSNNPSSSGNSLANLVQSSSSSHLIQTSMPPAQPPQVVAVGGSSAPLNPGQQQQQQLITTNAPHPASQCKVFINNLPFHVDWNDVKTLFSQAGTVVHAFVAYHNDTRSKGYGSVQFATAEEASHAIRMFNHQQWEGRILHVPKIAALGTMRSSHCRSSTHLSQSFLRTSTTCRSADCSSAISHSSVCGKRSRTCFAWRAR